ncbi:hypothetical protein K502DRAFT_326305 [Neoconidiobolus thromboides FSU 785]|nr:hypothetical protein K502DRAFT_326305 [Neoconidiobolus thromboides FSU 785]
MDLSIEEQEKVLIKEEENLKKKRIKVEKYKNLPIFKTSLATLSPEIVSNQSTSITLHTDIKEEANQVGNSKMNEQVENDLNYVNGTNGK